MQAPVPRPKAQARRQQRGGQQVHIHPTQATPKQGALINHVHHLGIGRDECAGQRFKQLQQFGT